MKRILVSLAMVFAMTFIFGGFANTASAEKPKCYSCGSGSSGACKKNYKCFGTRKSCKKKGCKITGYSSTCSSAANVKKCSTRTSFFQLNALPQSFLL